MASRKNKPEPRTIAGWKSFAENLNGRAYHAARARKNRGEFDLERAHELLRLTRTIAEELIQQRLAPKPIPKAAG